MIIRFSQISNKYRWGINYVFKIQKNKEFLHYVTNTLIFNKYICEKDFFEKNESIIYKAINMLQKDLQKDIL